MIRESILAKIHNLVKTDLYTTGRKTINLCAGVKLPDILFL